MTLPQNVTASSTIIVPTGTTHYSNVDSSLSLATNVNDVSGTNSFTGGYITGGNFSGDRGGALYIVNGTVYFTGGTLLGNCAGWGVAFYLNSCGNVGGGGGMGIENRSANDQPNYVNLSSNVVMEDNTCGGGATENFAMPADKLNLSGALTSGTHIGVTVYSSTPTLRSPVAFTQNWSMYMGDADPNDYFFSDSSLYFLDAQNGEVYLNCNTCEVTFAAGEGSGSMAGVTTTLNYTFPSCTFTAPEGKLFSGWFSSADGNTYAAGANVLLAADTTFTAQWQDKAYPLGR